jgi:hypothetical protein
MPRRTTTKKPATKITDSKPTDSIPAFRQLELPEREKLSKLLNDPVFIQAWKNAECKRPSAFPGKTDTELGGVIATNRLHQIQGWEMFKAALLIQLLDPKIKPTKLVESYPDSALP